MLRSSKRLPFRRRAQLAMTVTSRSAACPASNVLIIQSNLSARPSLKIAGHSRVTLPAQGITAPEIVLLNSPSNQDACENASFQLSYAGSARS